MLEGDAANTEVMTVSMSILSLEADVAASLQVLASQRGNITIPKAIAHIQQVLQVLYHVVSSLVSDTAHKVIVMIQAVHNTTQAMEPIKMSNPIKALK